LIRLKYNYGVYRYPAVYRTVYRLSTLLFLKRRTGLLGSNQTNNRNSQIIELTFCILLITLAMEKLNCDLFHLWRELLTFNEYHRLMNTSKIVFGSIKAATIVFPLSLEGTRMFLVDEERKRQLISILDKPDQFQSLTDTLCDFSTYLSCGNIVRADDQILSLRMNYDQYKDHLKKKTKLNELYRYLL
jgi:hypothetical protein